MAMLKNRTCLVMFMNCYSRCTIPRFQELCTKYEEEARKARNRRQKSTFPTCSKWIPTKGLSVGHEELLQAPSKLAIVYKMFVEDTK